MKRLFIYCSGTEAQIDEQEKATTAFAAENTIVVPRIFREHEPSSPHHWRRKKLSAALGFSAAGLPNRSADGLLVQSLEALGPDNLSISLTLYASEWMGVEVFSVATGLTPVKAEDDEFRQTIVSAIEAGIAWDRHLRADTLSLARKQSRRRKEFNEMDSKDDLTENMGYARRGNVEQRQFERGVVGWMFYQRFENKATIPSIAAKLAEARIPIPNPNFSASRPWAIYRGPYAWSVDTIRNVLASWKARTDLLREHYKSELPTL